MLRARAPRRLPGALRRGLTFWRRSIQARVVASTVILTAVVIAAVGWLLLQQTRDGLLDQRVKAVTGEVADEVEEQNGRLEQASGQDVDPSVQRRDTHRPDHPARNHPWVRRRGGRSRRARASGSPTEATSRVATSRRPACRSRSRSTSTSPVPAAPGPTRRSPAPTTTTRWSAPSQVSPSVPRCCCPPTAAPTRSTSCSRSTSSRTPWRLVARALLTAGVLMLVLVAGVSWLVTRQVVTPVRMARRVAERLAAGRLQERLRVSGRGRPGAARDVVQPDGLQPAAPDPPAGGAEPGATPVRLGRVPRAADAADHGADGRRRAARGAPRLRPGDRDAPPSCCSWSSIGSRRCSSTCWRSAASTRVLPCSRPTT